MIDVEGRMAKMEKCERCGNGSWLKMNRRVTVTVYCQKISKSRRKTNWESLGADPHLPRGYIENTLRTIK